MFPSCARCLPVLPVLLCVIMVDAGATERSLYLEVAPQLESARERFYAACIGGNPRACKSLQNLDEVLDAFRQTDSACQGGDAAACRELHVGVGVFLTGLRCHDGDARACRQLEQIEILAPACDEGDADACAQIEFALFGT